MSPKAEKAVRQSITIPGGLASEVRALARKRRVSGNRIMVQLIEDGIEAEKRKEKAFFELAERFRNEQDPEEAKRLGDELGRMVFAR
ncbi:MAG TPA: hypothetical protein VKX25_07630 [Bryobacteraceae bacterium]|jgi:hypothetical protein|nr:hypothetical protein [Bryobacteraceae bacterium]